MYVQPRNLSNYRSPLRSTLLTYDSQRASPISLTSLIFCSSVVQIPHSPWPPTPMPIFSRRYSIPPSTQLAPLRWISCKPRGRRESSINPTLCGPMPDPGRMDNPHGSSSTKRFVVRYNDFIISRASGTDVPWPLHKNSEKYLLQSTLILIPC